MLAQPVEKTPCFVVHLDAPLPPDDSLVRIPLAITGHWIRGSQPFSITLGDLEDIARNFQERVNGEINVDYDHASEMPEVAAGGPIPSAGRIVKLDPPEELRESGVGNRESAVGSRESGKSDSRLPTPDSRSILYGWYEPTERARQLIQNLEYRYISPAIDWTARSKLTGKPQGATLTSVALTNRPFLEELPQIRLSDPAGLSRREETGNSKPETGNSKLETGNSKVDACPPHGELPVSIFHFPVSNPGGSMKQANLSVVDGKIKIAHEDLQDDYSLDPEQMRKCLEELDLLSKPASPAPCAGATVEIPSPAMAALAEISAAQASAFLSEAEARGKYVPAVEFFRAQVERELDGAVKAGKILPRQRDDWRKIALSDFATFRKILAEQKPQVPLRALGSSAAPPEDIQAQVKLLVEQRCRERQISFGQALTEIGREHPELVNEYRRAVTAS